MKKEKGIDDIFKHGLEDPVDKTAFRESDWDSLENMLDERKGGGKVFWLPILGSVAAVLLAFFGWWMFKPLATNTVQNTQQVAVNKPVKTQTGPKQQSQPQVANNAPVTGSAVISKQTDTVRDGKTFTQQNKAQYIASHAGVKPGLTIVGQPNKNLAATNIARDTVRPYNTLAAIAPEFDLPQINNTSAYAEVSNSAEQPIASAKTGINALAVTAKPVVKPTTMLSGIHPLFAISALASSEVNGVGSFASTSKGTNVGLLFTVGVKKLSLTTGANYSVKPYSLPFSEYHTTYQFKNAPENVTADCRVLDIPINIGYQLYNKSSNKITLGTGLSSYIMMHESYTYDYGTSSTLYGPSYYAVKGKGKYLFSIMNLQATYERKVNSQVGLSLTPYLKVPLSDIGYSQVRVQTFGVAVGLNWNINSLTKPK